MKQITIAISFLFLGLLAGGCTTTVTLEEDSNLYLGLSRKVISSELKSDGIHQFSILKNTDHIECVSYSFGERYIKYYFLYKNDKLVSILDPRPFFADDFMTVPYKGGKREIKKPWNTAGFIKEVLNAETLSPDQFAEQIKSRLIKAKGRKNSYNQLPALIILSPLIVPVLTITNTVNQSWLATYNPFKAETGMKQSQVELIYGKPKFIVKTPGQEIHAYGPSLTIYKDANMCYLGANKKFWVAVVYENDVAVRVLSNDFFNEQEIVTLKTLQ